MSSNRPRASKWFEWVSHRKWTSWIARRAGRSQRRAAPTYTTPRMLPVLLVLLIWLAVAVAVAWAINLWVRGRPELIGENPDQLEVTRIVLTLVGGVGAVFVGVYAYRKQRIEEAASARADHDQFLSRYNAATEQLAHPSAAARLAGAYAMAQLADDWIPREGHNYKGGGRRQQCVDVLCAYLRMPPKENDTGDREVRATVLSVILHHVQRDESDPDSWSSLSFDFSRAEFRDAMLRGTFKERVSFAGAAFRGATEFDELTFRAPVTFEGATFESFFAWECQFDENVRFNRTVFQEGVIFTGLFRGDTNFHSAKFDGTAIFTGSEFLGPSTTFGEATFAGDVELDVNFHNSRLSFRSAEFRSNATFNGATWRARNVDFTNAAFTGPSASFVDVHLDTKARFFTSGVSFAPDCVDQGWEELTASAQRAPLDPTDEPV